MAVVFYSAAGNAYAMAQAVAEGTAGDGAPRSDYDASAS